MNGIVQYVASCDWLPFRSTFSSLIRIITCINTLFIFIAKYSFIIWIYNVLITQVLMNTRMFTIWGYYDKCWYYIYVQVFTCGCVLNFHHYTPKNKKAGSHANLMCHLLRNCQNVFQNGDTTQFLHIPSQDLLLPVFFILAIPVWQEVISHSGFDFLFPNDDIISLY